MKMTQRIITAVVVIILIVCAILIYQFVAAGLKIAKHASAEYPTAQVIGKVTTFVEENDGNWPTSWDDLDFYEDQQDLVVIRFDVTSEQILSEPELIYEVIQPVTGEYHVYPHSKENLDYLLDRIEYMKQRPAED